jgi:type I restriction enzyme M protein
LRSIDGLHADEALDELCKLLLLKIVSETDDFDEAHLSGAMFEPSRLSISALARVVPIIATVDLVPGHDLTGELFQAMIAPATRQGMGQYFTPMPIVQLATTIIAAKGNERVVDPFCGSGQFLVSARRALGAGARDVAFLGVEKSARMVRIAVTDALLSGLPPSAIVHGDSIFPDETLRVRFDGQFDCLLTNPPFGAVLDFGYHDESDLTLRSGNSTPLEIAGLERSVKLLRPGGRMAIVVPDAILDGRRTVFVREWMHEQLELVCVIGLPDQTFAEHGALQKTSLVCAQRRPNGKRRDRRVFLAELADVTDAALSTITSNLARFIAEEPWS